MVFIGSLLVILGSFWLLSNLDLISAELWDVFWPSVVILLGLKMLFWPTKWHRFWKDFGGGKKIKIE